MDRRSFLRTGVAALAAAGMTDLRAFASDSVQAESSLKVRFLGTGAADWKGRDERGELRRLSSVLLDSRIIVDLTPSALDMIPDGCRPESIFYTHSHGDHYRPDAALKAGVKRVYLSETWIEKARKEFSEASAKSGVACPEIIPMKIGEQVSLGDISFTALPASHFVSMEEQTLNYLIVKGRVRLVYAVDTANITAVAARIAGIDRHSKGQGITALIMEATMGPGQDDDFRYHTHASVDEVYRTWKVMERSQRYFPEENQHVYITHLARTLHGTQAELDRDLPYPLKAAYDGLEVDFR